MSIRPRQQDSNGPTSKIPIGRSNSDAKAVNWKHLGVTFWAFLAVIAAATQFNTFPSMFLTSSDPLSRKTSNAKAIVQRKGEDELPEFITNLLLKTTEKAYTFDPTENDYDESDLSKMNIRNWGCERRHDAPFIFVHIGTSSSGSKPVS